MDQNTIALFALILSINNFLWMLYYLRKPEMIGHIEQEIKDVESLNYDFYLILENIGKGVALDVEILLDDTPLTESPLIQNIDDTRREKIPYFGPKVKDKRVIRYEMGEPYPEALIIRWKSRIFRYLPFFKHTFKTSWALFPERGEKQT